MNLPDVSSAAAVPAERIPALLTHLAALQGALAARLLAEKAILEKDAPASGLLTAAEVAKHLGVPESWVRTEERAGRIPGVRLGRYVRFRPEDVEAAQARRER